jgi:phosphoglycolate phosphatase
VIRAVVFDFDGTLVASNAIKRRCFEDVVAHLPGGREALAAARSRGGDRYAIFGRVARALSSAVAEEDPDVFARKLAADYTRRCLEGIAAAPERRGARRALDMLRRRGVKIWVNSATPQRDLPALLKARGLWPLLEGALGGPRSKAQNLRTILAAEGVGPREAVMVGDGHDDEAAARQVGTWFIAVTCERKRNGWIAHGAPDLVRLPSTILRLAA